MCGPYMAAMVFSEYLCPQKRHVPVSYTHLFTVNINDRRILRAMLEKMGFAADQLDSVCISFDKMDKIGADRCV